MRKLILSILSLLATSVAPVALAANINLYETPDVKAKVVATVDSSDALTPIYYPNNKGEWLKIANPKDGTVGWVKTQDLKAPIVITSVQGPAVRQTVIMNNDKGQQVYHVEEYSSTKQLTPEEIKNDEEMDRNFKEARESLRQAEKAIEKVFEGFRPEFNFQLDEKTPKAKSAKVADQNNKNSTNQ